MRIHNRKSVSIYKVLPSKGLHGRGFTSTGLPDNIKVPESILSFYSNFFFDASMIIFS
jgi:hypothetical protein